MSAITHNTKYNKYQIKGTKHLYLFSFDYCQQVKKDLPYKEIPRGAADEWYESLGAFRRKNITVMDIGE